MILGEFLAFRFGKNVLLIDMDAQANLSYCMVAEGQLRRQEDEGRTTYHLLRRALKGAAIDIGRFITQPPLVVSNVARSAGVRYGTDLHMVVSTPSVAQLDEDLLHLWETGQPMPRGLRDTLAEALKPAREQYDYVLIDCPPGLSIFSSTALMASDYFIPPLIPEPLSLEGVNLVQRRATDLRERFGAPAEFGGVVLNIVKHYRRTHQRVSEQLYNRDSAKFRPFQYWLPDNDRLRSLGEFDPDIQGQWAGGADEKFSSLYAKYSLSYTLGNPATGVLSRKDVEGPKYRLEERINRLVQEFQERCGGSISP